MAHIHNVIDTDPHYKIDGVSRTIVNIDETKRELVQGDHNSERFTFEMPRYFDGHDFSECNVVQIHYENADTYGKNISSGIYTVEDLQVKHDDDEKVMLSWLASNNATKYVGTLGFSIRFVCSTDGELDYVWSTKRFDGITILQGVCNSEDIVNQNPDIIIEIMAKLNSIEAGGSSIGTSLVGTEDNPIIIRELETGFYTLIGEFEYYKDGFRNNSTSPLIMLVNRQEEKSFVLQMSPTSKWIVYHTIFDDTYTSEIMDLEADAEYDAESKNAQSGIAVAQAIENSLGYVNEVLATLVEVE